MVLCFTNLYLFYNIVFSWFLEGFVFEKLDKCY